MEFCGLRILVDAGVFVPRQRTAFLVQKAVAWAAPDSVVLDLCCGAGAIGAAITARLPGIDLYAADIDPAAVASARRNIRPDRVFEANGLVASIAHSEQLCSTMVTGALPGPPYSAPRCQFCTSRSTKTLRR